MQVLPVRCLSHLSVCCPVVWVAFGQRKRAGWAEAGANWTGEAGMLGRGCESGCFGRLTGIASGKIHCRPVRPRGSTFQVRPISRGVGTLSG